MRIKIYATTFSKITQFNCCFEYIIQAYNLESKTQSQIKFLFLQIIILYNFVVFKCIFILITYEKKTPLLFSFCFNVLQMRENNVSVKRTLKQPNYISSPT